MKACRLIHCVVVGRCQGSSEGVRVGEKGLREERGCQTEDGALNRLQLPEPAAMMGSLYGADGEDCVEKGQDFEGLRVHTEGCRVQVRSGIHGS